MDTNVLIITGKLAAPADLRITDTGEQLLHYLVTVEQEEPRRRIDVLPIEVSNPAPELLERDAVPGERLYVVGSVSRRFPIDAARGRRSTLVITARSVEFLDRHGATVGR